MNVFEKFAVWMGFRPPPGDPELVSMREALDTGRRTKRAEAYAESLQALDHALEIARKLGDPLAVAVINLHRSDVLICQGAYGQADALLKELRMDAETRREQTQMAYVVCSQGTLEQAKENWAAARTFYEEAKNIAKRGNALGAEGRAMGHLADTYLHERNASYAVHLLREALPKLNASGDIELSSYFVGRLGEALIETGQTEEGYQLINRALRLAEHMQYRPYERQWRLVLARLAMNTGSFEDAHTHFRRAFQLFDSAGASPEKVRALAEMSRTCLHLRSYDEALEYAQEAYEQKAALDGTALERLIEGTLGIVLRTMGRSAEAIPHLEKVAAPDPAEEDTLSGDILRNLAAAYVESKKFDRAEAIYQQAAEEARKSGEALQLAQAQRDLGQLHASRGDLQAAIDQWRSALAIYEANNNTVQTALLYCDIGNARRQLGQGQRALKEYEQALMLLNSFDDQETRGVVLSNAATAYVDLGDVESAEAFFVEAIDIASKLGDKRAEATRRGNLGYFLLMTDRLPRAENELKLALKMSQEAGLELQVAVQMDNLGLLQSALNNHPEALRLHEEALERVLPLQQPHWENFIRINKASTLAALGRAQEAERLYVQALEAARAEDDLEVTVRALIGLAHLSLREHDLTTTEALISEALALARRAEFRRLKADALLLQSELYAADGKLERAAAAWEEARRLFTILHAPQARLSPAWLSTVGGADRL